jgi:hypothetical protein
LERNYDLIACLEGCWIRSGVYTVAATSFPVVGEQEQIGGIGATRPALLDLPGKTLMVWRGIDGDDRIFTSTFDGKVLANQSPIAGVGTNWGPSLTRWGAGAFMAWEGVSGDTRLWSSNYNFANGQWSPQRTTGITSGSGPAVVGIGSKLLMVWRGVGDTIVSIPQLLPMASRGRSRSK